MPVTDWRTYSPVFFEPGWTLEKYHGWSRRQARDGAVHLVKRQGPFKRHLLLFRTGTPRSVAAAVAQNGLVSALSAVHAYVYNPEDGFGVCLDAGRTTLERCPDEIRVFNTATFVHDLTSTEDEIQRGFDHSGRARLKEARKEGVRVTCHEADHGVLDRFVTYFEAMAEERSLRRPDRHLLKRMLANHDVLIFEAAAGADQRSITIIIVYLCGDYGYYLHGATNPIEKKGHGQFLHLEIMRELKRRGVRWYDLGGLPSMSGENGIFRFKRTMGGLLVGPSVEYAYWSPLYRAAHVFRQELARRRAGRRSATA